MIQAVKGRELVEGQRVEVYYNLHRHCFSLRCKRSGLVVAHAPAVTLQGVALRVSQAGRARVLREGRKNVHALIEGTYTAADAPQGMRPLYYNPYKVSTFTDRATGASVAAADWVRCEGKQAAYTVVPATINSH